MYSLSHGNHGEFIIFSRVVQLVIGLTSALHDSTSILFKVQWNEVVYSCLKLEHRNSETYFFICLPVAIYEWCLLTPGKPWIVIPELGLSFIFLSYISDLYSEWTEQLKNSIKCWFFQGQFKSLCWLGDSNAGLVTVSSFAVKISSVHLDILRLFANIYSICTFTISSGIPL